MQKFIAKEVKPSTGDKKPTIIITEDGTKLSGFHASLKNLTPGTEFEADIELKGNYNNIVGEVKIIKAGNGAGPTTQSNGHGYKLEDPRKMASIETQNAITNVMKAYIGWPPEGNPPVKLQELWDRALAWCDSRIPLPGQKVEVTAFGDKERTQVDAGNGKTSEIVGPPFKDSGDFWSKAHRKWGKTQSEFCVILSINKPSDINDFDWAWMEIEKNLTSD